MLAWLCVLPPEPPGALRLGAKRTRGNMAGCPYGCVCDGQLATMLTSRPGTYIAFWTSLPSSQRRIRS
jgi:hypothetical protein